MRKEEALLLRPVQYSLYSSSVLSHVPSLTELPDAAALTATATQWLEAVIRTAIAEKGHAVIGLSGGSTPGPVYGALARAEGIDWSKVWIFLVDDRHIRADDPKSNQFLLRSTLLTLAPIPESQLLFPDPSLPIDACVRQYDQVIASLIQRHGIDAVTLGMGDDGHTASLFPPLPEKAFGDTAVIHTQTERFDVLDRISLTLPTLSRAESSLLLLKGAAKKKVWEDMMGSKEGPSRWPLKALINRRDAGMTVLYAV